MNEPSVFDDKAFTFVFNGDNSKIYYETYEFKHIFSIYARYDPANLTFLEVSFDPVETDEDKLRVEEEKRLLRNLNYVKIIE